MSYEELLNEAFSLDVEVVEKAVSGNLKGLYSDNTILIDSKLSNAEKCCILAEELGHHYTTAGDIIDFENTMNRKQERIAHNWAIERLIPIEKLEKVRYDIENGYRNLHEIAEELGLSYDFLVEGINYYKIKELIEV